MFERILVPLDGSELAEQALPLATRLAQASDREQAHRRRQATAYLKALQKSDALKGVSTRSITPEGEPASVIINLAANEDCDLIVMTTNGERGLMRWIFGSVTERVLRNATCPVLVLREDVTRHPEARPIQYILVPLDGSKLAESSIAPALEVARRLDAAITLMRVDDSLSHLDDASLDALDQVEPSMSEVMRVSHAQRGAAYLTAVRNRLDTTVSINIFSCVGKPVETILDTAISKACDLVMSTHGRSGIQRWVYGSVTEKVLHSAEIPLLFVRPEFA